MKDGGRNMRSVPERGEQSKGRDARVKTRRYRVDGMNRDRKGTG